MNVLRFEVCVYRIHECKCVNLCKEYTRKWFMTLQCVATGGAFISSIQVYDSTAWKLE